MGAEVSDVAIRHGQMVLGDLAEIALGARERCAWGGHPGREEDGLQLHLKKPKKQSSSV